MATNLRLRPDAEAALREESERSGRSQQDLIREAVDRFLAVGAAAVRSDLEDLVARGLVRAPRAALRRPSQRITLPHGVASLDLLDRDDRL